MRQNFIASITILLFSSILFLSCDKSEQLDKVPIAEYNPTIVGKYITYRVDSTVFTNFGTSIETHKYRVKHVVNAQVTDNLGRPSYRIYTYITDSAGAGPWVANGSYLITPTPNTIEVIENNLRVIKLNWPAEFGTSWKGNRHLPSDPYEPLYNFSTDDNMNDGDFYYEENEVDSIKMFGKTYYKVISILQNDEAYNAPVVDPQVYGSKAFGLEKYSRNIGLVYREYILWEYQPPINNLPGNYKGFGIKMWMIDHN